MRIAILTTPTPHHVHFARAITIACRDVTVISEIPRPSAPAFETRHAFEELRDRHESDRWFSGHKTNLEDLAPTHTVDTINSSEAVQILRERKPDLVLVFGTRVIKQPLIDVCADRIYNLHGGDPEEYRGLDTHLWAIYHRDFAGLVTTLHQLDAGLDTGRIILQGALPMTSGLRLHELRAINTEMCITLATALIDMAGRGTVPGRTQRQLGRYYSAMPAGLKGICQTHFEKFTASLPS